MTLVDTSVWIDHLRRGDAELAALLEEGMVLVHPFVIGEIAAAPCASARWCWDTCGTCPRRPSLPKPRSITCSRAIVSAAGAWGGSTCICSHLPGWRRSR